MTFCIKVEAKIFGINALTREGYIVCTAKNSVKYWELVLLHNACLVPPVGICVVEVYQPDSCNYIHNFFKVKLLSKSIL